MIELTENNGAVMEQFVSETQCFCLVGLIIYEIFQSEIKLLIIFKLFHSTFNHSQFHNTLQLLTGL